MVIYQGPSQIDGSPVVAILTESKNRKVGQSLQAWIMRADMPPREASRRGLDVSVCGDCAQRHSLGGACYVQIWQAPRSIYAAWRRGSYENEKRSERLARRLEEGWFVRLCAYGDPGAVPWHVWESLLARSSGRWSGYTHQWRKEHAAPLRQVVMASCDSIEDLAEALADGWRAFLVRPAGERDHIDGAIECLSDARGTSCRECTACDGVRGNEKRVSVWIAAHGPRKSKYHLQVMQ